MTDSCQGRRTLRFKKAVDLRLDIDQFNPARLRTGPLLNESCGMEIRVSEVGEVQSQLKRVDTASRVGLRYCIGKNPCQQSQHREWSRECWTFASIAIHSVFFTVRCQSIAAGTLSLIFETSPQASPIYHASCESF